tara:strand:- start:487 stop:621 length:135 start_codon:yes stop_codon:yes gene_type:complete
LSPLIEENKKAIGKTIGIKTSAKIPKRKEKSVSERIKIVLIKIL